MAEDLAKIPDWHLLVIYRIAKKKLRPFFADPHAMIALRQEIERRGLTSWGKSCPTAAN